MHCQVRDVMSTEVVTARPDTPYKEVVRLLAERRVSALPVVDDRGRVAGVVSEADLLLKEALADAAGGAPAGGRVGHRSAAKAAGAVTAELMTRPAITVRPYTTVAEAARVLTGRGVKRAPVVDADGRLVGIVSRLDLLLVFLRADDQIRQDILLQVHRSLGIHPDTLDVSVHGGVVALAGQLERRSLAVAAVSLVRAVDGVVDVVDRLGWQVDDRQAAVASTAG